MSLEKIINGIKKAAYIGLTTIALMGGMAREAKAKTYYVNPGQNIQAAINDPNVVAGDEIIVAEGRYYENINFKGKNIVLRSTEPNNLDTVVNTILDGNQTGSVVTFNSGEDANCVLNGFTIINGSGTKEFFVDRIFSFGGGIYCNNSSPVITRCNITSNNAFYGAGIFSKGKTNLVINKCSIDKNATEGRIGGFKGGGIYCWQGASATITDCLISENHGVGVDGSREINNCEITKNSFVGISGASIVVNNSIIADNGGTGIMCYTEANVSNCLIRGNGDGIHVGVGSSNIQNCTITEQKGDGLSCGRGNTTLANSIVCGNGYRDIYVWRNQPPNGPIPPTELTISYSNIEKIVNEDAILILGAGNINADPCFANPNNDDYHLKSQAGRYDPNSKSWVQDNVTSPCIDAGDPRSPIGYEPFPNGGIINMGAYGGTAEASKTYFNAPVCETIVAGDINGDCKVDFKDFAILSNHWLEERGGE